MADIKIDWAEVKNYAGKFENMNNSLNEYLKNIQKKITSLQGDLYEANSAVTIRDKITGMTPRFEQYYNVVSDYVTFLRRTADEYADAERSNDSSAKGFI